MAAAMEIDDEASVAGADRSGNKKRFEVKKARILIQTERQQLRHFHLISETRRRKLNAPTLLLLWELKLSYTIEKDGCYDHEFVIASPIDYDHGFVPIGWHDH